MDEGLKLATLVNWTEVCIDLKRHGYGPVRIAEAIGISRTTVQSWSNARCEPRWHSGTRLLHLWAVVASGATPNPDLIFIATLNRHR